MTPETWEFVIKTALLAAAEFVAVWLLANDEWEEDDP